MSEKTIRSITARKGVRGGVNKWSFSGVEAQDHIDEYMEEIRMTKTDLDNYESNASASATAAEASAKESAKSAGEAADSAEVSAKSAAAAASSESNAASSAAAAAESRAGVEAYATEAQSWAVGGTQTREGEDTDNSKYYAEQSNTYAGNAEKSAQKAARYVNSDYALMAKSYAVGGTGTRDGEDTENAKWYYEHIIETDVGDLAELEKMIEKNLNSVNHEQNVYPAFFADRLADVTDLNDCTTNGLYQFTATSKNAPASGIGLCAVFNSVASGEIGYIAQYAWLGSDAHTVYARDDHGGTWGTWEQVGADGTVITDLANRMTTAESEIDELQLDTNSIQEDLTALIGTNTGKSIATIALEVLTKALIPEDASASMDELKEIAAWIQQHPEDAAAMNKKISALQSAVATKAATTDLTALKARVTTAESDIDALEKRATTDETTLSGKADKATTLAGYGITNGATKTELATVADEVNARPSTRKLSTQTLTAEGGTLTWTDSCIGDNSLIDVYASIANIAPSEITQSGTTVTVTFDAQDADMQVAIVVM